MIKDYVNSCSFREALEIPQTAELEITELARGEYNINYVFVHPVTGRKLVLRLNTGSQMHLEHQIEYEYNALKLLEKSGRTPQAIFVDASLKLLPYGVLVMEFLSGRPLIYETDMNKAAAILADIHALPVRAEDGLICPPNPLAAILDECRQMVKKYDSSPLGELAVKKKIAAMLDKGERLVEKHASEIVMTHKCCVNTELNAGNFLINDGGASDYLIDWEKPVYGDPAQDLGHFLAPTTTLWKTDVILKKEDMRFFSAQYLRCVAGRYSDDGLAERVGAFVSLNCLRGITWSAMAWVEYQEPGRLIKNEATFKKMCSYLKLDFLEVIDEEFLD